MPANEKNLYLTFDDGPHPEITDFVMNELDSFNARATFFCVGSNVAKYPMVFKSIIDRGHTIGNHTHTHLNGWNTGTDEYRNDIADAAALIDSPLFRPPYGRIRRSQAKEVPGAVGKNNARIVMWDVLSGDFDVSKSKEQCLHNVIKHASSGSIIVFHDSEKAYDHLSFCLPRVLENFAEKGYRFMNLDMLLKKENAEN